MLRRQQGHAATAGAITRPCARVIAVSSLPTGQGCQPLTWGILLYSARLNVHRTVTAAPPAAFGVPVDGGGVRHASPRAQNPTVISSSCSAILR